MVQLTCLEDFIDLDIKSLQEVIARSSQPWWYKRWEEIEAHLINDGIAPSLPAYLLYEHQFKNKSTIELCEEFGTDIKNMMKRMNIPIKNTSESLKGKYCGRRGENHHNYGKHLSEEHRRKISAAHSGENNPMYGRHQSEETRRKISKALKGKYSGKNSPNYGSSYPEERRRKMSESLKGKYSGADSPNYRKLVSEETREKMSESAIKRKKAEERKYYVEGRFYADSLGEGATALLLEKYIPGYKIIEGETFQANADTICLYDFILGDIILEWHPIRTERDAKNLGFREDLGTLLELREEAYKTGQRKAYSELARQFVDKDLTPEYLRRRQNAADNSQTYNGTQVNIARNERELYDFLKEQGAEVPNYSQFRRERNELIDYVRQFKVESKKKAA